MRIAVVTDDGLTICPHFGRADRFVVIITEEGRIVATEERHKPGHNDFVGEGHHGAEHEGRNDPRGHGFGRGAADRHARMIDPIADCEVLLARGMGRGAALALEASGVRPVTTDLRLISDAVEALLRGELLDRPERRH